MKPIALIIDCDPGVDDAVALMLALSRPDRLDVRAITTVAGNVGAALTARNASLAREAVTDAGPPVHSGGDRPLQRTPVEAGDFHGSEGLGDLPTPPPRRPPEAEHAAAALIRHLEDDGGLTLAALGPLTNLALVLRDRPDLAARIERIVLMGGADRAGGNITPHAEYNIFADPHAARIVFEAGVPITVLSLDVTHQARVTEARLAALAALTSPRGRMAAALAAFSNDVARRLTDDPHAPIHDACVIAWLVAPGLFQGRGCTVRVETDDPERLGQTTPTWTTDGPVDWITGVDADGLFALLTEALA